MSDDRPPSAAETFSMLEGHGDLREYCLRLQQHLRPRNAALDATLRALAAQPAALPPPPRPAWRLTDAAPLDRPHDDRADLALLLSLGTAKERAAVIRRARKAMRGPGLVEALLAEAISVRGASAPLALELAAAAILVARRISAPGLPLPARLALLARAEAHHANAQRLLGRLAVADREWRTLNQRWTRRPIADPQVRAELLSLEASLRIDRREFTEAEALLAEAEGVYRELEDRVGVARALVQRGTAADYGGDPAGGADLAAAAVAAAPEAETELRLRATANLANALINLGRVREAEALLDQAPPPGSAGTDDPDSVRLRWARARIATVDRRFADAAALLGDVVNDWFSLQRPYDAALAILDCCEVHLAKGQWPEVRGKWQEVRRLAGRLAPLFEIEGVHRETKRALRVFQEAAVRQQLSLPEVGRFRRYLTFSEADPAYRFDPEDPLLALGPAPKAKRAG